MANAIASGLGLSLTINWRELVKTSKEIHSNPQKSKDYYFKRSWLYIELNEQVPQQLILLGQLNLKFKAVQ